MFTLSAAGTAAWVLRYRYAGRRKELTLGNYPDLSLAAARKLTREHRVSIDQGGDPATANQEAKTKARDAWLMKNLAEDYREKCLTLEQYAADTIRYRNNNIDQVILPRVGARGEERHANGCGRRAVKVRSHLDYLQAHSDVHWPAIRSCVRPANYSEQSMCRHQTRGIAWTAAPGEEAGHASRARAARTSSCINDVIGEENALALRILLATCVRSVELLKAEKAHLNFVDHT